MSKSIKLKNDTYWDIDSIRANGKSIGYIVESGSNDNGSWIKYSNGILIQNGSHSYNGSTSIQLPYGGYRTRGVSITFPLSFLNLDNNVYASNTSDVENNGYVIDKKNISKTGFSGYWWTINSNSNELTHTIDWCAIGKWK